MIRNVRRLLSDRKQLLVEATDFSSAVGVRRNGRLSSRNLPFRAGLQFTPIRVVMSLYLSIGPEGFVVVTLNSNFFCASSDRDILLSNEWQAAVDRRIGSTFE